jgi:glycosyltransferase involved in cell wall biosynthesis
VAGYDSGAIGEWLDPGAGALVARGDHRALAAAIQRLTQADTWTAASAHASAVAKRYGLEVHVDAIDRLYRAA